MERDAQGRSIWTDETTGLRWEIIDCWKPDLAKNHKRLDLGSWKAETRAFKPIDREGPVMLYVFNRTPYRDTTDRNLRNQLSFAKPARPPR